MSYPQEITGTLQSEYPTIIGKLSSQEEVSGSLSSQETLRGDLGDKQIMIMNDYEQLTNIPCIEGIPLIGNKSFSQLQMTRLTNSDIEALLQ